MQQVDVQSRREIARQPCEEQVEDIVVRAEPQNHPDYFTLPHEIAEGGLSDVIRSESLIVCRNVIAFNDGQFRVVLGIAIDSPEGKKV